MISSRVRVTDTFADVTRDVENLAKRALEQGAREGARVAEEKARPGLKHRARVEVIAVHGVEDGYAAGFRSTAKNDKGQPIGHMHDKGTYGNYRGRGTPRRRGRAAKVGAVNPRTGETTGIKALNFNNAGRTAGRKAINREISRGI